MATPIPRDYLKIDPANYYDPYHQVRGTVWTIEKLGEAYSHVPPYALGYNPYPTSVTYVTPFPAPVFVPVTVPGRPVVLPSGSR